MFFDLHEVTFACVHPRPDRLLKEELTMQVPLYILAGGESRRFGADKARATLHGEPLVARVARRLAPISMSIRVVADAPDKYKNLGLTTLGDETAHRGPLGGLARALQHCEANGGDWLLLAPCDWLNPSPAIVQRLLDAAHQVDQAVAFFTDRWQPLPALYHRSIAPTVAQQLSRETYAMWRLLDALPHARAVTDEVPSIVQCNTPEELRAWAEQHASD
jgi:molybdopterin-guanine dinucleotide biosynthesis protein A